MLLLASFPATGCSPSSERASVECSLDNDETFATDIDPSPDFNASMFFVRTLRFEGHKIRLLGFEPGLSECAMDITRNLKVLEVSVGSRGNCRLYLGIKKGRLYAAKVLPISRGSAEGSGLTCVDFMRDLGWDNERSAYFTRLDPNAIYIETKFYETLAGLGVKIPPHYKLLPDVGMEAPRSP